jgi:hypothetical protein
VVKIRLVPQRRDKDETNRISNDRGKVLKINKVEKMSILKNINPVKNLARALRVGRAFGRAIFNRVKVNEGRVSLASLLIVSVLVLTGGLYYVNSAKAASLTSVKATLIDPRPATASENDFSFTTVSAVNAGGTIKFTYPDAWTINTSITNADITATGMTVVGTCGAGSDEVTVTVSNTSPKNVTLTVCTGDTVAAGAKTVNIGTGSNKNTNPTKVAGEGTADIYSITIGAPEGTDSGTAMVAIIEGVAVSVTVEQSLSFSIAGVTNTSCTEGGTATAVTTTATTVPFGTSGLSANTFYKGCHDLTLSTNAPGGYAITSEENTSLLRTGTDSSDKTLDDAICDAGTCTEAISSAATWATPSANQGFGYTCSAGGCDTAFASATKFVSFACRGDDASCDPGTGGKSPSTPISSTSPVSSQVSRIVYKLSFSGAQPAGTYSNAITYVATPTF